MQIQPAPDDNTDNPAEVPVTAAHPPRPMREEQLMAADVLRRLAWGPNTPIEPELFDAHCGAFTTTGCELMVLRETPEGATHGE